MRDLSNGIKALVVLFMMGLGLTAFADAGDCEENATSISVGETKTVKLVNEWDAEWQETTGNPVHVLKIVCKKGKGYTVTVSGSGVSFCVDVPWSYDKDAPWFDYDKAGMSAMLYESSWEKGGDYPGSIDYYVYVSGESIGDSVNVSFEEDEPDGGPYTETVSVAFDANGGSVAVASRTYVKGGKYTSLPVATRAGYVFAGWFTAAVGGQVVTADSNASSDITLYAHWNQVYEPPTYVCTVTFDANGGSGTTKRTGIVSGESVGTLPVATREGYTFVGWFTSPEGGSAITSATVVTSSISFYAHWTENSTPTPTPDPEPSVNYDEQISEWSSSLSSHGDPTAVWVDDETVYLDEVELPYTYQCGAVLHKTKGGYRLDLPGIDITDLCIQANGDLAILVTGENIIRVNSNRGDFNVERMPGMFYSGIYAHNLFVFGPGSLTIVGEVDSRVWGTTGILADYYASWRESEKQCA